MTKKANGITRIELLGIRGWGHHGVFAFERQTGQEFVVDIGLQVKVSGPIDDLSSTVDYGQVTLEVQEIIAGEPVQLIETLAERIAARMMMIPKVRGVEVRVHKPHAPLDVPVSDVIVTIHRGDFG